MYMYCTIQTGLAKVSSSKSKPRKKKIYQALDSLARERREGSFIKL